MKNTTIKNLIGLVSLVILFTNVSYALAYGVIDSRVQTYESSWSTPVALTSPSEFQPTYMVAAINPNQTSSNTNNATTNNTTNKTTNTTNTTKKTTNTATTTKVDNTANSASSLPPVVTTDQNNLPALSVQGNGGFMPSSVFQWLLVIILIFAIIIVVRIISRPKEIHETHMVGAH